MKLTKSQLKRLIKEELRNVLNEQASAVEADEEAQADWEEEERERAEQKCKGTKKFYQGKCYYPDQIKKLRAQGYGEGQCRGTKKPYRGKCLYPDQIKAIKRKAMQGQRRRKQGQEEKNQMSLGRNRYKNYLEFKKRGGTSATSGVDKVIENLEAALQHFKAALKINPKNRLAKTAIFSIPKILTTLEPQPTK